MRLISRIDVKNEYVIKGIHLEGLRKVGSPNEMAERYYREGVDEIIFMDAVASLYDRNNLFHIISQASEKVFIPITIGGGIKTLDNIQQALHSGADKVAINTGAVKNPEFIVKAAKKYGSQCIVGSVEAKKKGDSWEAYVDNGREPTGLDAVEWSKKLIELGVGELLITSIDQEGTKAGFDVALMNQINKISTVPVIASGGMGRLEHISELINCEKPSAMACASIFHYDLCLIRDVRHHMRMLGVGRK